MVLAQEIIISVTPVYVLQCGLDVTKKDYFNGNYQCC